MPADDLDQTEFVHLTLPATPAHLTTLREMVHRCLAPLPIGEDRREEVVLAVGEAVANSVEHAYVDVEPGTVELTFWTESGAICVEVADYGTWRPPPPDPRPTGEGLGIPLMHRLIDSVLIRYDRRGTRVLLRHPMGSPAPDGGAPASIPAP